MEPQERRIDSPLRLRFVRGDEPRPQDLSKTTLGRGRSNGWAECREKKTDIRAEGEVFSLDIPFNRTSAIRPSTRTCSAPVPRLPRQKSAGSLTYLSSPPNMTVL